jgi:hypothetical protein
LADLVVFISAFMADDPFVEMRKAAPGCAAVRALFAAGEEKVKQIRHFLDG